MNDRMGNVTKRTDFCEDDWNVKVRGMKEGFKPRNSEYAKNSGMMGLKVDWQNDGREGISGDWKERMNVGENTKSVTKGRERDNILSNRDGMETELLLQIAASNARICMPKHEIECFDGNAAKYTVFKGAMREINRCLTLSYEEKLHYAYQYTRGEPQELVLVALHMEPKKGFNEVWRWFDEKYGAPESIAADFMEKLLNRPPVSRDDVEGLKSYAVALRLTMNVMDRIPYGKTELEHPKTIRLLVSKLSFHLQDKWRVMSSTRRIEEGLYLGYTDLVKFVERVARLDSDPLFGKEAMVRAAGEQLGKSGGRRRVPVNVVTQGPTSDHGENVPVSSRREQGDQRTSGESRKHMLDREDMCTNCDQYHSIYNCKEFIEQDVNMRWDIIQKKNGCYLCLQIGHIASRCPKPIPCEICGRYHHSLLHFDRYNNGGGKFSASNSDNQKSWHKGGPAKKEICQ